MIVLGLTGSIGMGKTTSAGLFAKEGVRVHDSDTAVHELYAGAGASLIENAFPGVVRNGSVDRQLLAARVLSDAAAMRRLESIVHPYVGEARRKFLETARLHGNRTVLLDIPLLFEIGGENEVDAVIVATATPDIQRARVLARPGMDVAKFDGIIAKQLPDSEKRRRAHFVIRTDQGIDSAHRQILAILRCIQNIQK